MEKRKGMLVARLAISLVSAVGFLSATYFTCGIWFETNDDVFISEMLSGKLTGLPEYHCPYVSSFLTYPISKLYSVFPGVPWWGILLAVFMAVTIFLNIFSVTKYGKNLFHIMLYAVLFMGAITLGIHNFGQAQFTSAAMLLAVTGYIALAAFGADMNMKIKPSGAICFGICEFMACSLRSTAMMLVQPVGFCFALGVWVSTYFSDKNTNIDSDKAITGKCFITSRLFDLIKVVVLYFMISISCIGATKLIQEITFFDSEWKTYQKYDTACVYIFDYVNPIEYEEIEDVLGKYNISEIDYKAFLDYRIWYGDYKFSNECIDELLPRLEKIRRGEKSDYLFDAIKTLLFSSGEFWSIHKYVICFFAIAVVIAIVQDEKKKILTILLTFSGYVVGIVYLAYRNRYAFRVMIPYYSGTIFIVTALILLSLADSHMDQKRHGKMSMCITGLAISVLLLISFQGGRVQFSYIRRQNKMVNEAYYSDMMDMTAYCNKNLDKHFVMDCSYARYSSTDIFDGEYYKRANYIYSGSWYGTAPSMITHGQEYLSDEKVCLLVYEAQEWRGADAIQLYECFTGRKARLIDKFKVRNGATIWVYEI